MSKILVYILAIPLCLISCKEELLPKPKAQLRLNYERPSYFKTNTDCAFDFQKNRIAQLKRVSKHGFCGFRIYYPNLDATIYLTYRPIRSDLNKLLKDAQNLTYEHVVKADNIATQAYSNKNQNVHGMVYKVSGDAASPSQFYLTDSTHHFLLGSVYFNTKPNYDSILPGIKYLENDLKEMIESLSWK